MSYIIIFFYIVSASIIALSMIGNVLDEKEYAKMKRNSPAINR